MKGPNNSEEVFIVDKYWKILIKTFCIEIEKHWTEAFIFRNLSELAKEPPASSDRAGQAAAVVSTRKGGQKCLTEWALPDLPACGWLIWQPV